LPRQSYRQSASLSDAAPAPGLSGWLDERPQLPYLIPFMAYVALMAPASFGHFAGIDWKQLWRDYHPLIYACQNLIAAAFLFAFWRRYTPIRWSKLSLGLIAGLFGTLLWIGIAYGGQAIGLSARPDPATFYNPTLELHSTAARIIYYIIRVGGPTLVVPVMEELFFRDFLMRALVRGARFDDVPVGTFTWFSFIGVALLFGLNHGREWPEGVAYGLLMGILLIRTRSLGACIVAHAATNLTLYLYVIHAGDWQFM
jgi:hypothetical protein